jgi:hypothetical protein
MDSSPQVFSKEEGLRLLKAGQLEDAIKVLEKVRDKTDDAQVCAFLGAAYSQKGDKANAIHAFEESLRLNETPKAYFNLAVVYEAVGRIDEAAREYRMAVELDPNYTPAQEALKRVHDQFISANAQAAASAVPAAPAVAAAAATQSMPAAGPVTSQTQSFAGPPPIGSAPVQGPQPLADPFAPPQIYDQSRAQADMIARQMAKEQAVADQHHAMMKSGIIYGAICGAIFFMVLSFAGSLLISALGGRGLVYMLIQGLIGAAYGSVVGLWIGYTCGGDSAGFQAGAVLGLLYGFVCGLLLGSIGFIIVLGVIYGLLSGIVGWFIGRMVEMSISD